MTGSHVAQETNRFRVRVGSSIRGNEEFPAKEAPDGYRTPGKSHGQRPDGVFEKRYALTLAPHLKVMRYKLQARDSQVVMVWREGDNIQMKVTVAGECQTKTVLCTPAGLCLTT